jgi:MerR, DNA binding
MGGQFLGAGCRAFIKFYENRGCWIARRESRAVSVCSTRVTFSGLGSSSAPGGSAVSLPEIRELLILQQDESDACCRVRGLLRAKIAAVRGKLREFGTVEKQLTKCLRKCEGEQGFAPRPLPRARGNRSSRLG